MDHVPTLNDLRVKSCFICLEEEREPGLNTANDWVHPCPNCASVAHDKCLIRWISSLPLKQSLKREDPVYTNFDLDTFKCPHCGRPYEMANPRPPALHGLAMKWDTFYVITSEVLDLLCAAAGFVTIQVIPVTLSLQSRLFVLSGVFLYELYFLESFLGPHLFSLLLTRKYDLLQSIFIVAPTIPFRLLLPGTLPRWIIPLYLSFPPILHILTELEVIEPLDDMSEAASASHSMISFWPPSPALLGLSIAAVVRPMYNLFLARFRRWVLGTAPPPRQKRYLSNRVRSLLSFGRRAPAAVPAIMQDQDPARIVIADQIIQKDQSSLTHDIVHAVSCVAVPRIVGELLRLASSRSYYLRRFLGIRPPSMTTRTANWASMSTRQRAAAAGKAVAGLGLGGSWIWTAVDPVWWRYSLGYGAFVLGKDCFELYRLWLQNGEVQSRTIKSRDFAGVDIAELDLISPEQFS